MMRKDKGIALILAIIVVTMVSLLLTSYVAMTISERKRVEHESAAASAEYIARAGLEKAFFDLSCEYEKDRSWADPDGTAANVDNEINDLSADVPNPKAYIFTEDPTNSRSDYRYFPFDSGQSWAAFSSDPYSGYVGKYSLETAFVTVNAGDCPGASCAFRTNRLWVRSTGRIKDATGNTIDEVSLAQLARVKRVAVVELEAGTETLKQIKSLYDTLMPAVNDSDAILADHEIRISGDTLDEDVVISGKTVTIKGGYGYDFTDGSRDTSKNVSTLTDSGLAPMVTLSGTGTITMGGVRIE